MIKFDYNKKKKELYVKLVNRFVFAFKMLTKTTKGEPPKIDKDKIEQDFMMQMMDIIPKEKRQYH